ncbi:efflux RND transporter periplasmic adaptor subunit [bacterium]|nr:efflux RND transporter periplasmic adaptor subunit [bacterium]
MKKWLIIGAVIAVVGLIAANLLKSDTKATEVDLGTIVRKNLVETVTASGTLTPKRKVDVSANTIGKVTRLAVAEGDRVVAGQFLLEIDPTEYASVMRGYQAAVRTAKADLQVVQATVAKTRQDLSRVRSLFDCDLKSQEQLEAAETNLSVDEARVAAAEARFNQAEASLDKARYDLDKVTITAPMGGVVTRLNVEEGENAIMGTLNNPGTVLLVIADLATMEAEVDVDETEVVRIALGQAVGVEIDAFPDTTFVGVVTEIGNSPIYTSTGQSQQAVDFKVTVTLTEQVAGVRPGLSAEAEITVAESDSALAVPIGAVVIRKWPPEERPGRRAARGAAAPDSAARDSVQREEREGVFLVTAGTVAFRPVELGITGEEDFELLSGVEAGDRIVTGPFRELRGLEHGDAVKEAKKKRRDRD